MKYAELHNLNISEIATQFAAIKNERNQLFDTYGDVIPVVEDGISPRQKNIQLFLMRNHISLFNQL
jgi:fructosamine-3-kinase